MLLQFKNINKMFFSISCLYLITFYFFKVNCISTFTLYPYYACTVTGTPTSTGICFNNYYIVDCVNSEPVLQVYSIQGCGSSYLVATNTLNNNACNVLGSFSVVLDCVNPTTAKPTTATPTTATPTTISPTTISPTTISPTTTNTPPTTVPPTTISHTTISPTTTTPTTSAIILGINSSSSSASDAVLYSIIAIGGLGVIVGMCCYCSRRSNTIKPFTETKHMKEYEDFSEATPIVTTNKIYPYKRDN